MEEAALNSIIRAAEDPVGFNTRLRTAARRAEESPATAAAAWRQELRAFVASLEKTEPEISCSTLADICALGVTYAWPQLEAQIISHIRCPLKPPVATSLKQELHGVLLEITDSCFALMTQSSDLARAAILGWRQRQDAQARQVRLPDELIKLFVSFPVLARLWASETVRWRQRSAELFERFAADRAILRRSVFAGRNPGALTGLMPGLSDRHHGGRSVTELRCKAGAVIYKPRNGDGEWEWQRVLALLNRRGFRPVLRRLTVVRRSGYCWMEHAQDGACRDVAAVRRFYRRAGALAAAAEIVRAVDCHKGNLIAAGEHPVLVDAEALLHPPALLAAGDEAMVSGDTQFFSLAHPRRGQNLAALSAADTGAHVPRLSGRYMNAHDFEDDIWWGFTAAWRMLAGTAPRRASLKRVLNRISEHPRRRIYRASTRYTAFRKASLAPALLRNTRARREFLQSCCDSPFISPEVSRQEVEQLSELDIPCFAHEQVPAAIELSATPPPDRLAAIRRALRH